MNTTTSLRVAALLTISLLGGCTSTCSRIERRVQSPVDGTIVTKTFEPSHTTSRLVFTTDPDGNVVPDWRRDYHPAVYQTSVAYRPEGSVERLVAVVEDKDLYMRYLEGEAVLVRYSEYWRIIYDRKTKKVISEEFRGYVFEAVLPADVPTERP